MIRQKTLAIVKLRTRFIRMPETRQECAVASEAFFLIAKFPTVIAVIDGTHVKIQSVGGDQAEPFRNRKGFFSLNVEFVAGVDLSISHIGCGIRIWKNICKFNKRKNPAEITPILFYCF